MVWCSGWRLASAVSSAGGLGLIGAGSMHPDVLAEHIGKCRAATGKPFGVNVPLLYPEIEKIMEVIVSSGVKIVFTSAGNPATWTPFLKERGITVVHVVSNTKFARKAAEAGVDAIVAEGFEAGGHNGREETTTMVLIPHIRRAVDIPLIAAGGIGSGQAMLAALALGAEGVQVGSLFAATEESSAHPSFKELVVQAKEGDTMLMMKKTVPVRLLKNPFFEAVREAEARGADAGELKAILGKGRAKRGMFEGDMEAGELEIGQVAATINTIRPVADVIDRMIDEYETALARVSAYRPA
jgi:enoyl-[acyl-carrier protein] reductase II